MIRLGRIYRGLMVEVQATNAKLGNRKKRMLCYLTGQDESIVEGALHEAGGDLKLAAMLLRGCDLPTAEALVRRAGGNLRTAIELADRLEPTAKAGETKRPGFS
jgi:N-acetylmuramic acid 6-phosphate etherase